MEQKIDGLPDWTFRVDEISTGVYRLHAQHAEGPTIELTGTDPEKLLSEMKVRAATVNVIK